MGVCLALVFCFTRGMVGNKRRSSGRKGKGISVSELCLIGDPDDAMKETVEDRREM